MLNFCFTGTMPLKDLEVKLSTTEEEYKKNPGLKKEDIEELRQWLKTQPELPDVMDGNDNLLLQELLSNLKLGYCRKISINLILNQKYCTIDSTKKVNNTRLI